MALVEWNLSDDPPYHDFNLNEPILALDHQFNMVLNPNDYSFSEPMIRLHSSFKNKCRNALAAIRLTASRRVGFNYIYHVDSSWNTLSSFRLITEDPSPISNH